MTTYTINYGNHNGTSAYQSVQELVNFLIDNPNYNYAGFVEFKDGIKIIGVMNEIHFINVFKPHATRAFFIGRGSNTWNGIFNFGNTAMFNPNDRSSVTLEVIPTII